MPKFVVSSYERAAHQALFGFRGKPANLVVSALDPEAELPTDFVKAAASIGWDKLRHLRVDIYDTVDPIPDRGGINETLFAVLKELAGGITEGENVLVHCKGGISRSPAVVIALLAIRGADWRATELAVTSFLRENAHAVPNVLLVSQVDRMMGYAGKLEDLVRGHRC